MRNRRALVPLVTVPLIVLTCWFLWHNSPQQKLQRCVKAQTEHFYATPEGQELHRRGSDPPAQLFALECKQMGVG